jgi:hypothetical protein
MTGLVRNGFAPWFALLYGADGSVFLTARAAAYIPQCSFFKVTFAASGFIAVPFATDMPEFYVGWVPQAMSEGQERTVQIGGFVGPVPSNGRENTWLKEGSGTVIEMDSPYRPENSFGYAVGPGRAMLFPVMVRKDA